MNQATTLMLHAGAPMPQAKGAPGKNAGRHPEWGQFKKIAYSGAKDEQSEGGTPFKGDGQSHRMYQSPKGDIVKIHHMPTGSVVSLHKGGNMKQGKFWKFSNKFAAETHKVKMFGTMRNK